MAFSPHNLGRLCGYTSTQSVFYFILFFYIYFLLVSVSACGKFTTVFLLGIRLVDHIFSILSFLRGNDSHSKLMILYQKSKVVLLLMTPMTDSFLTFQFKKINIKRKIKYVASYFQSTSFLYLLYIFL